ncbi:unnamed protein product [Onchocerca flexuosa]|uniref:ACB domain-containing protein n=1 Tax=Onchocerca flexuosa TaxID=387005 RepID=A0A183HXH8_9BILA|nr:unnamed protein product [Onchocerca flexuosa]
MGKICDNFDIDITCYTNDNIFICANKYIFIDPSKRPRIYDVINREKFDAWSALSNMSRAEAMRQYVARLVELNLGWDPNETYHIRFGIRPSTMADAESTEVRFFRFIL